MADTISPVTVTTQKGIRIVEFNTSKILDEANIAGIEKTILDLIGQSTGPALLLDFSNVDHLSSAALGTLIKINNEIKARNGKLRLTNIKPQIFEVFRITKLDKLFRIKPTRTEALADLGVQQPQ